MWALLIAVYPAASGSSLRPSVPTKGQRGREGRVDPLMTQVESAALARLVHVGTRLAALRLLAFALLLLAVVTAIVLSWLLPLLLTSFLVRVLLVGIGHDVTPFSDGVGCSKG